MPKDAKPRASKADGSVKKGKADKDPNAPKRPLSAYMIFSQDNREKAKADNPDASFGELGKILGKQWKEMDDEDKKPYTDKAEQAKEKYAAAKEEYEKSGGKKAAAAEED